MTDDKRSFTRGEDVPERIVPPDTLFGLPVVVNTDMLPTGKIHIVLSDWDEWIEYRWRGDDGRWYTQWGRK